MAQKFKIDGLKEVQQALRALPDKLSTSVLKSANTKAAREQMLKPLKSRLPYSENVKSQLRIRKGKGPAAILMGPSTDVFYIRFVDKGTVERYTKSGAYRGKIRGEFHFRQIHRAQEKPLLKFVGKEYKNTVEKILKSRIKSTGKRIAKL